jgi:hypothetical protein
MRTTIDMPPNLLQRAKTVAAKQHTTLRMLMVDALERRLNETSRAFKLRDAAVGESGDRVSNEIINQAIDAHREGPFKS